MIDLSAINFIDSINERLGRGLSYLSGIMVIVMATVVFVRYGLDKNSIALQESVTYLHGALFMLAMGYALKHDSHVRVDIFYRKFGPIARAWVNCLGILIFLLPLSVFFFFSSLGYVASSWRVLEGSDQPGGLPGVFLLKTLIPLMAVCLALQAVVEFFRNLLVLIKGETRVD